MGLVDKYSVVYSRAFQDDVRALLKEVGSVLFENWPRRYHYPDTWGSRIDWILGLGPIQIVKWRCSR